MPVCNQTTKFKNRGAEHIKSINSFQCRTACELDLLSTFSLTFIILYSQALNAFNGC